MKKIMLYTALLLNVSSFTYASTKIINSEVGFTAVGRPAFIKATGTMPIETADLTVKDNVLSGKVIVSLKNLESGIEMRDTHLKEKYLQVNEYPKATLTFKNIDTKKLNTVHEIQGELTLHGVTKPISIKTEMNLNGDKLNVEADFTVILTDYSIELPSFQGITAAKNVEIKVNSAFELNK